jgi:dTDP-4-amino-4,6-dideoxygalactose transaminase
MRVPFVDLRAQYAAIGPEIDQAIQAVIADTAFIGGPYLRKFEEEFAAFCEVQYAVGVSNGTDALRLALLACGIGPGDEVITVPNTFIATAEAISMIGAQPRFVDVDAHGVNMDPSKLEAAITPRTRALLPVYLYGQPADMGPILEIARRHNLKVIGDAAQAHGARYKGRPIAALGDASCFSFYPGKNLGAYGDAGAVCTNDPQVAENVASLRDHGRTTKYEHDREAFNCRMDALQGAILSVKLRYLDEWTESRRAHARRYSELLAGVPGVTLLPEPEDMRAVYHLYVIRTPHRDAVQQYLQQQEIATGIHYPVPLHLQPAYQSMGLGEGTFPRAEAAAREILSLPIYAELTDEQLRFVVEQVGEAAKVCA